MSHDVLSWSPACRQDHLNALTNVMATYAGHVPSQDKKRLMNPQKENVYGLNPIISMLSTARWWHIIYIYIYILGLLHWIPLYLHCNHLYSISPISPLHPQSNPKISPLHLYYALFSLTNNHINNIPIKLHPLYISSQSQCSISPQYPHSISPTETFSVSPDCIPLNVGKAIGSVRIHYPMFFHFDGYDWKPSIHTGGLWHCFTNISLI